MMIKVFSKVLLSLGAIYLAKAQAPNALKNVPADSIIISVFRIDQQNREELMKLMNNENYPKDSLVFKIFDLKKQDARNQQQVFPLIDQYINNELNLSKDALNGA
ncbi:MAG: hypothetical protein ACI35Z_14610 [Sphingobacterium hotanense]